MKQLPLIVVTDLDGTLLDHDNYDYAPAAPALEVLRDEQIPLILNTSKTFSEVLALRRRLDNHHPFIFENGAGVAIPDGYFRAVPDSGDQIDGYRIYGFTESYEQIRATLSILRMAGYQFRGFGDMEVADVVERTGLTRQNASMAKKRLFSEPIEWLEGQKRLNKFKVALYEYGYHTLQGGRFIHVMGPVDKAFAINWLKPLFGDPAPQVMALGDSDNDEAMLKAADFPVLVKSPAHSIPAWAEQSGMRVTREYGPQGWNECVLARITQMKETLE